MLQKWRILAVGDIQRPRAAASIRDEVHHRPTDEADLLEAPGLGRVSVTVMARTALFPHARSRTRGCTPAPQMFFRLLADAFRRAAAAGHWVLPSLAETLEFHQKVAPSPSSAGSSKFARSQ